MSVYNDAVLADIPLHYWPLQETEGPVEDLAGTNDGTVVGATLGQTGPAPNIPNAVAFDGVDDEINVGASSPNTGPGQPWTYEGWVLFNALDVRQRWLAQNTGGTEQAPRLSHADTDMSAGVHGCEYRQFLGTERITVTVSDGAIATWYHVVAVHTGSELRLYVDKVLRATATDSDCFNQTGTLAIGSGVGEHWHNGRVAAVAVYPSALSAARIEAHYDAAFEADAADPANLAVTVSGTTASLSWDASPLFT